MFICAMLVCQLYCCCQPFCTKRRCFRKYN